jgi:MFS family permease
MCFAFFFFSAIALSVVQAFAPEAARQLHGMPQGLVATCLTVYMVCSAGGMLAGGFLAADPTRCERIVGVGFGVAASVALVLGLVDVPSLMVPVLFGVMGFASGTGGPSRDLIVKRSTPANSTGRVYGVVYSGLDIGQALAPLIFGTLMDRHQYPVVFMGLALTQAALITTAFNVGRVRRSVARRAGHNDGHDAL